MSENSRTTVVLDMIAEIQEIERYGRALGVDKGLYSVTGGFIEILRNHLNKERDMLVRFGYEQLKHVKVENGEIVYTKVPEEIFDELYLHNYQ